MTMKDFNKILGLLGDSFGREITPRILQAYSMALNEYDEKKLIAAGVELMKGEYFPKPFDFIQLLEPKKPRPRDAANSAWAAVKHWAWEKGTPPDRMSFKAMRGVCDRFMLERADEHEINGYGFAFRSNYEILLAKEEAEENRLKIEGRAPCGLIGEGHE